VYADNVCNPEIPVFSAPPSAWVKRFAPLIRAGGRVLDLFAGSGRYSRLLLESGFAGCALDRDVSALLPLAGPGCKVRQIDLEAGAAWPLDTGYDGIVVTNYLHRPLLPVISDALAPGGVQI
jgi:SAM-dependent methyltransferase